MFHKSRIESTIKVSQSKYKTLSTSSLKMSFKNILAYWLTDPLS